MTGIPMMIMGVAAVIIGMVFIFGSIIGLIIFIRYQRKYNYLVQIWTADSDGNIIDEEMDKAGIFVDRKTKAKHFWLKKHKKGLQCDNVPYRRYKNTKIVTLLHLANGSYRVVDPKIRADKLVFNISEEDVNWAIYDYEKQKKKYAEDPWAKWIQLGTFALVVVAILILMILLLQKFEYLAEIAHTMDHAATVLAEASSGTTVIQ